MNSNAKFRICCVVPAYNRAHLIREALDSISAQTRAVDEVVIVDDGSTDDTVSVAESWMKTTSIQSRLIRQANRGAAAARNTAIRATDADLIAPLDSDDVWVPEHVALLERAFLNHPNLVVSGGNTDRLDDLPYFKRVAYDETLFERFSYHEDSDGFRVIEGSAFTSLLNGAYIQTGSCIFRREDAQTAGLFEESLRSYEDQLFFMRLSRLGPFALHMDPVTLLRKHDDNTTHRRHIASHILCAIRALEIASGEKEQLKLDGDETTSLHDALNSKLGRAADRASRYGFRPFCTVGRHLIQKGHWLALMKPKPVIRAMLFPLGSREKN